MTDTATLPPRETLKSARAMAEALPTRWAGEGADYRAARTALLAEEIELRPQIQRVAAMNDVSRREPGAKYADRARQRQPVCVKPRDGHPG